MVGWKGKEKESGIRSVVITSSFVIFVNSGCSPIKEKNTPLNTRQACNVYEQRFQKLMMLMRIDRMLEKAVVMHKK